MKRGFFILLVSALFALAVNGQTIKTDILVIGNGSNALGAGMQAAVSGVKTTILMQEAGFELAQPGASLHSGLEAEYLKKTAGKQAGQELLLKNWTDSTDKLTVIRSAYWSKLKRSGSGWSLELNDGRKIKARVLVNADRTGRVSTVLMLEAKKNQWVPFGYEQTAYRTSIGAGLPLNNVTANVIYTDALLVPEQENLVMLNPQQESLLAGQAAGATAGYAAFFKKKTSETNLKELQGELIKYKLSLVPFADISELDSNWKSIQFIGLSGVLKGALSNGSLNFNPEKTVTTDEVKEPIKEYYYKAQIWFDDYKQPDMTTGSTLALICYVKGKSLENTTEEVKKKWKKVYGFKDDFDPAKSISRREFAVLVSDYLQPFNVTIDKTGRVMR
ncbi:hypothetical protein [Pedobacter psychroterrae]|uniref:FAD dependent oxidoreductase n=1 Tax=Pedobacter psychroterrae TaxID=2530453 RepID=A0A4R0NPW8_9SPHI|nr:hypothetical protein [Pedobacter psychroterrae]TCD03062.1 hypothetical protein EZ437_03530 [Pedobacter psychroterrae]